MGAGRPRRRRGCDRAFHPRHPPRRLALRRPSERRCARRRRPDPGAVSAGAGRAAPVRRAPLRTQLAAVARAWMLSTARRAVADRYPGTAARPRLAETTDWRTVAERAQPAGLPGFEEV